MKRLICTATVLAISSARAAVIHVDADTCPSPGDGSELNPYCRIQSAIFNAVDTDEIVVAAGTYFETINFLGKAVTLRSTDGAEVTIIDAQRAGNVVTCHSGEGPATVLYGFTITGGGSESGDGGGMSNRSSSPTVLNCVFTDNLSSDFGGGIYNVLGSSPTVTDCLFVGNTATSNGGGMSNSHSTPKVTNCVFIANSARGGGAMYNSGGVTTVTDCKFTANTATYGGAIYNNSEGSPAITNCVFIGNSGGVGGAMSNFYGSSPTVTNCTFIGNIAAPGEAVPGFFGDGGGMFNFQGANPIVTNCTFAMNSATMNGNGFAFGSNSLPNHFVMNNCIVWGGDQDIWNYDGSTITINYTDFQGGFPGTGNIDTDPLFVDTDNGDFRLSPGSPCIDAGHNKLITSLTDTDLDGNPRFADDPATSDTGCGIPVIVDMGPYEYQGNPAVVELVFADLNNDGVVTIADLIILNGCTGSDDADCCLADLDIDGEVGLSDRILLIHELYQGVPFGR